MFNFGINSKWALITGASSGIGKVTAELFVKLGANVMITGRSADNLNGTYEKCKGLYQTNDQKVLQFIGDLRREDDLKSLVREVSKMPQLDILINNAGIIGNDSIEDIDMQHFDNMMNINLRAIVFLTNLLVPNLVNTKGNIVNISSVTGVRAFPNVLSYCISKAAVEQFTKCVALELAPKGIRVNAVSPGVTITNLHRTAGMDQEKYDNFLNKSKLTHALGRPGQAEEIAKVIAFVASPAASFMTGASLPVDGGRHAMCPR